MPISDDEWDAGATEGEQPGTATPVGEYDTERDLIVAFLSENVDQAFTRAEIVRGVDFGNDAPPETVGEALAEIQNELVDLSGDLVASGLVVDDVEAALDALVEDGTVAAREVDTGDGTTTYYRLNTGEARE